MSISNRVGVISPNPNLLKNASPESLAGSLHLKRYSRFPGSVVVKFPYKESNNSYRTGLDENALYIQRMSSEEAKREKQLVKELAELAEQYYPDYDILNPRSSFWSNMSKYWGENRDDVAEVARLIDGENYFPFSEPMRLIQYAYLRVHPSHAPSSKKLRDPKYAKATYYVNDEDTEIQDKASIISTKTKYRAKFYSESPENKRIIARLLGYAVTDGYGDDKVVVILEEVIEGIKEPGDATCRQLDDILSMKVGDLRIRDVVRQSLLHSVIRKGRDGALNKGEIRLAESESDYVLFLTAKENKEDLNILVKELNNKKGIND